MKKTRTKYLMLMAVGLLVMNVGVLINYLISIADAKINFFKGLGFSLVIVSFFMTVKDSKFQRPKQT
jgi:hypothetical protein